MSLCIPKVHKSVKRRYIFNVFKRLDIGHISYVKMAEVRGSGFNMAFIFLNRWKSNERVDKIREVLQSGDCIRIMYSYPMFWKCYKNKYDSEREFYEKKKRRSSSAGSIEENEVLSGDGNPIEEEVEEVEEVKKVEVSVIENDEEVLENERLDK